MGRDRRPERPVQVDQIAEDRGAKRCIETRIGARTKRKTAGRRTTGAGRARDPLTLAAGERLGPPVEHSPSSRAARRPLQRAFAPRLSRRPDCEGRRRGCRGPSGKERAAGPGKHHSDVRPLAREPGGHPLPPIQTDPAVGGSRPATSRKRVLLPDPDGPTIARNSPSSTVRSTPRTASTPFANAFPSPRNTTPANIPPPAPPAVEASVSDRNGPDLHRATIRC